MAQGSVTPVNRLKTFVRNMENFNKYFPQEKVYLHFDNTAYFRGEDIWVKAYVMRDDRGMLTDISKVLYVELLSPTGEVMETKKLHLENGQADTRFRLDSLFYSGFYEVRAYTRYMLNWDERGIFSRVLPVFSAPQKEGDYSRLKIDDITQNGRMPSRRQTSQGEAEDRNRLNVSFFPEGGSLVKGLRSRVAFEVTDREGRFVETSGTIDGDDVHTLRDGRGVFSYIPSDTVSILTLKDTKGKWRKFSLPKALEEGCIMTVEAYQKEHVKVTVCKSAGCTSALALVLVKGGAVEAFDILDFDSEGMASRSFRKSEMSDGVNQIALINDRGDIIADRLVFVYPKNSTDTIAMTVNGNTLSPCGKISIKAKTRPEETFSIAVRDRSGDVNGTYIDAASWMLLSSDLKGYIRHPEYYMEKDDEEHRQAVDLLMMVQGWRRYHLDEMTGRKPFRKSQPVEDGLYLFGRLKQVKKKNSVDNVKLKATLFNGEGASLSGAATTDKEGCYAFKLPDCEGDWTLLMNTQKEDKDTKYHVVIDRNFSPQSEILSYYDIQKIPVKETKKELLDTEDKGIIKADNLIREIKVKGKRRYRSARDSWESEQRGAFAAYVKYDCVKEADAIADRGEDIPDFYTWLAERNSFFGGEDKSAGGGGGGSAIEKTALESMMNIRTSKDEEDLAQLNGMTYKGRPIVWIWNNTFYEISGMNERLGNKFLQGRLNGEVVVYDESINMIPEWLDDYKAVYIAENDIWTHHLLFSELTTYHPVTIFLYSPYRYRTRQRGIRRTVFEGYTPKVEFYSPDYSMMAPMPDFRRTLYWNPNVKTDKNGEACIEFYNNSTCRQLVISAEGITKDGTAILYKQE